MKEESSPTSMGGSLDDGLFAARAGDTASLQQWIRAGNNPNQYDAGGWTPLLWASARGHSGAVQFLINNNIAPADTTMGHRESEALPIHLAGHSGSVETAGIILDHKPEQLNAVWDLNGHTILLQAVFYGHLDLAEFLLKKGAKTEITTARGLGPLELATQFQNRAMIELIRPYDTPQDVKAAYYKMFLERIAPIIPLELKAAQQQSDELVSIIQEGLRKAAQDDGAVQDTMTRVRDLVDVRHADVNRLGGPLMQPPLIVTVTGNNGNPPVPAVAKLRNQLAEYLLDRGADPTLHEKHPMGAQTIIRAAVFNHLEILKMCAKRMTPQRLADAINEVPLVNGLTAMHDTALRATMASPDRFEGYLQQAAWFVTHGGRSDIEDFAGVTQRNIAEKAKDPEVRRRLLEVLDGRK